MAHQHQHAHLVRRQRDRDDEDDDNGVQTIVSVRYVTAQNTYTVPVRFVTPSASEPSGQALIAPAVRPPSDESESSAGEASQQTSIRAPRPSATPSRDSDSDDTPSIIKPPTSSVKVHSSLDLATKTPSPTVNLGVAITSATASITAAASGAPSDGGMSVGGKAGLALGILFVFGALLTGVLLVYRRKKKQQFAALEDNEKIDLNDAPRPLPPQVQAVMGPVPSPGFAPSTHTERNLSAAPRLSLRPVTEFDPALENGRNANANAGNFLGVGAAAVPAPPSKERDLPGTPRSAWERPGAANVGPAENPFNDPQLSSPPTANPFGNDAALDPTQAHISNSPPNASPLNSTKPGANFANPSAAIASADAAAIAIGSVPTARNFPPPPSPAWTEDFPSSPGPAPAGPLPAAGANNVHRVQLDFKPSMQDELGLHAGQLVRMLHEYDDGWALCIRMDRSQQGVVPRTCLSKHSVKPRAGPPRQGPPPQGRGPPVRPQMGPGGIPQPRPLTPASGRNSPGMSPGARSMSPGPRQMSPQMQGSPRGRSNSNAPQYGPPRGRSNSNAPYAGPQRSMSPGPYGGGPQMSPPPQMGRPRSNSASQVNQRRGLSPPGPSPMNPNPIAESMPSRKPVPGMAL